MNQRITSMRKQVRDRSNRPYRQKSGISILDECQQEKLSWMRRAARLTIRQCQAENVVIGDQERIVFARTLPAAIPALFSDEELSTQIAGHILHELGPINNICADWGMALSQGLAGRKQAALEALKGFPANSSEAEFLSCAVETIDAVLDLAWRYARAARSQGRVDLAQILERVPAQPPSSFQEALQALRILQAVLWLSGHYHAGFGRFDQYMWPYLKADLEAGRLDEASASELLAEFFLSLNKDSDLYPGVQQGDNGQTITLGGVKRDGSDAVNPLTSMVLRVSRDLGMIDPKINLRISPETSLDLLSLATELTRKGLGFPQYSNDEVVIPGLVAHGYLLEDARDYVVAACWEFIIPGRGMEVVNIGAVSFPSAVDQALRLGLPARAGMDGLLALVQQDIQKQVSVLAGTYEKLLLPPAPFYSVLMRDCLETGRDISFGAQYNNFGIHGAGASNAADALAAVQQFVFQEKYVQAGELISALDANFEGYEDLRTVLADRGPKVGNDDPRADMFLVRLFEMMADACERYGKTSRGGILRPGTGSAMYYIWLAEGHPQMREPVVGATAEGRRKMQPLSANLAPSLGAPVRGPFSVLLSFAKIDYRRVCNGGPITIELSSSVFRDQESTQKVALLVHAFAEAGCQQLQLNSLDPAQLLDAQLHPELHKDLIVRVWGWSGYFCELGKEYQDQILARHMYEGI